MPNHLISNDSNTTTLSANLKRQQHRAERSQVGATSQSFTNIDPDARDKTNEFRRWLSAAKGAARDQTQHSHHWTAQSPDKIGDRVHSFSGDLRLENHHLVHNQRQNQLVKSSFSQANVCQVHQNETVIRIESADGETGAYEPPRREPTLGPEVQNKQQLRPVTSKSKRDPFILDPAGSLYYHWSMIVSMAFLYNFWSLSYRFSFEEITSETRLVWFTLDYLADGIYVFDLYVNFRTGYLEDGVLQRDLKKIAQHYQECTSFYIDCFCLLPLDFLYLSFGYNSILRCPRLCKIYKFWSYVDRTERHTNYPNVFRTFTLVHYIVVIFHWNACLLNMIMKSKIIDIEDLYKINENSCTDVLCEYLHAFYWSTLALTTVGDLPRPRTKGEYIYVTVELLFGLFLFASVLGHVANIVTNVSAARKEFQAKLDGVKTFMRTRRVSDELQDKVIRWFDYLWISQKSSDEDRSVACLPDRLKAEIAIHVHLDTLKRVDIFQNTDAGFLCELVLRLRPVLFSPGDFVCRKNEVGHEMYIVSRGVLEVVTDEGQTVATLKAGSYFGEISVLNVGQAGNKRTASVRSVGYSDLFCLNKQDLWDVLKNYPNAERRIRVRAEERLSKLSKQQQLNDGNQSQNGHRTQSQYLAPPSATRPSGSSCSPAKQLPGQSASSLHSFNGHHYNHWPNSNSISNGHSTRASHQIQMGPLLAPSCLCAHTSCLCAANCLSCLLQPQPQPKSAGDNLHRCQRAAAVSICCYNLGHQCQSAENQPNGKGKQKQRDKSSSRQTESSLRPSCLDHRPSSSFGDSGDYLKVRAASLTESEPVERRERDTRAEQASGVDQSGDNNNTLQQTRESSLENTNEVRNSGDTSNSFSTSSNLRAPNESTAAESRQDTELEDSDEVTCQQ